MYDILTYPFDLKMLSAGSTNVIFNVAPVCVMRLRDRRISQTHWHDYLQIWYTVSGSYFHTVNGERRLQEPGSAVLIFPYTKHSIDSSRTDVSKTRVIQISVRKGALEQAGIPYLPNSYRKALFDRLPLRPWVTLAGTEKKKADGLCEGILAEYSRHREMREDRILQMISSFLILCTKKTDRMAAERELALIQERNQCIEAAITYLQRNLADKVNLEEVSGVATMCRKTFTDTFYAVTGQTCHSYLDALRMGEAIRMLKQTDKSIAQIAGDCGFFDSSHFSKKCSRLYGVSPLVLRRRLSLWMRQYGDDIFAEQRKEVSWAHIFDEAAMALHRCSLSFY